MRALGLSGATLAMTLLSGCVIRAYGPPPAEVTVGADVEVGAVPDDYTWDGYEYVGVVGGGYYYLGPNHVWVACDPVRLERFHGWERVHPDWHAHAIHNTMYRRAAHQEAHDAAEQAHQQAHDQHVEAHQSAHDKAEQARQQAHINAEQAHQKAHETHEQAHQAAHDEHEQDNH